MSHDHKNYRVDAQRRHFLFRTASAVPAAALVSLTAFSSTVEAAESESALQKLNAYTPLYFNAEEWAFLLAACDHLIPADELGGGALEANVPLFIDQQMLTSYGSGGIWYMQGPFYPDSLPEAGHQVRFSPKEIYRVGIREVNYFCLQKFQSSFELLSSMDQVMVLEQLHRNEIELESIGAKVFFDQLLTNVKEGFFSDPMYGGNHGMIGWQLVGFPGARADFMDWQSQHNKRYPYPPVSIAGKRGGL